MKVLIVLVALFFSFKVRSQSTFTIHFDFNKYQITDVARSQLDSFIFAENQDLSTLLIELNGHCDAIGSDDYNNKLSKRRVEAVKKYLLIKGINPANIMDETGHGEREPLNENKTEEERQQNRRVELSFKKVGINDNTDNLSLIEKIGDSTTKAGTNLVLRNINFVGGRHQFLKESALMLTELLDAMETFPKLIIRVEGHICCIEFDGDGPDLETGINNLSEARARAVNDYLVANGISAERVSYKGFGHSSPIYPYPEKTEEERIKNRRVEIKIISK